MAGIGEDHIALFEFDTGSDELLIASERHYVLVPPEDVTDEDLAAYQRRPEQG